MWPEPSHLKCILSKWNVLLQWTLYITECDRIFTRFKTILSLWNWRESSVMRSTCCSSTGPEFTSKHPILNYLNIYSQWDPKSSPDINALDSVCTQAITHINICKINIHMNSHSSKKKLKRCFQLLTNINTTILNQCFNLSGNNLSIWTRVVWHKCRLACIIKLQSLRAWALNMLIGIIGSELNSMSRSPPICPETLAFTDWGMQKLN